MEEPPEPLAVTMRYRVGHSSGLNLQTQLDFGWEQRPISAALVGPFLRQYEKKRGKASPLAAFRHVKCTESGKTVSVDLPAKVLRKEATDGMCITVLLEEAEAEVLPLIPPGNVGDTGIFLGPEDVICSDVGTTTLARMSDAPMPLCIPHDWPEMRPRGDPLFKEWSHMLPDGNLKDFVGKGVLRAERCELLDTSSEHHVATAEIIRKKDCELRGPFQSFRNSDLCLSQFVERQKHTWKQVHGFLVFELEKRRGQFVAIKHWWNEDDKGKWIDMTPLITEPAGWQCNPHDAPRGKRLLCESRLGYIKREAKWSPEDYEWASKIGLRIIPSK
mmetsp:Transcript_1211/g.2032  ORF Transcript_1211/g.2032 Transcript_1211/m.2032 type:complete len:331 (+) Transcript_1211:35-1027(+)